MVCSWDGSAHPNLSRWATTLLGVWQPGLIIDRSWLSSLRCLLSASSSLTGTRAVPGVLKVGDEVPPAKLLKRGDTRIWPLRAVAGVCRRAEEKVEVVTGAFLSDMTLKVCDYLFAHTFPPNVIRISKVILFTLINSAYCSQVWAKKLQKRGRLRLISTERG